MDSNVAPDRISVEIVTAGAGTGKTHRITTAISAAVAGGLAPTGLLATTFTVKAAAELQERVQAALARAGQLDAAVQLPEAMIGTVNAVCGRLLTEFALEAGLPPDLATLDETAEAAAFADAVSSVVAGFEPHVSAAALRLGLGGPDQDWRDVVRNIARAARANRLTPGEVIACGQRSLAGITGLLDAPAPDGAAALDARLAAAMRDALEAARGWDLAAVPKLTKTALDRLRQAGNDFAPGQGRFLPWSEWAALSKLAPGKKQEPDFAPVLEAAAAHRHHPRLADDIRVLITVCFEAASRALELYAAYKRREGLLDFCDQESLLLDLLERDADVRAELAARLRLVFVDEFQDTSPLQLALFLRLARLAPRSIWVGDPKQSIFAFRGTDPTLMQAALAALPPAGGDDILGTSRRSRPGLVAFANALFVPAFAGQGMAAERVRLAAHRADQPGHAPPLQVWRLPRGSQEATQANLAAAVAAMLTDPARPLVQDRATGAMRRLLPGDVAILCKRNKVVADLATNLQARGLRVAAARAGLLETAEIRLALACLRRLASGVDSLAAAEIAHFAGGDGDAWLATRLADRTAPLDPRVARLDAAREGAADLSPVAALHEALAVAELPRLIAAWPAPAQRLANIEALFAMATQYEEACRSARRAATPGGLVAWLQALEPAPEQPASLGEDAVSILTYHRAKGLEWPLVVMCELNHDPKPSAFAVAVEPRADQFDVNDPLAGRWVRYWPWPYGRQSAGIPLLACADASPEQLAAEARAAAEALRLGYVGVTRARDYLVLALETGTAWLDRLAPGLRERLAALPAGEGMLDGVALTLRDVPAATEAAPVAQPAMPSLPWPDAPAAAFPPRRVAPSRLATASPMPAPTLIRLGPRLARSGGAARDAVGEALHHFLGADDPALPLAARSAMAAGLLRAWAVEDTLHPEDCIEAADRLWRFLAGRYGAEARMLREWPLQQRQADASELHGRIDLVVQHRDGLAVLDHKSFPGADAARYATDHAPQLLAYAAGLEANTGETVTETIVHLPLLGVLGLFTLHGMQQQKRRPE